MQSIYASQVASISELKKNPTKLINEANGAAVAILNHNTAAAYLVPVEMFEQIIDVLDEHELQRIVEKRLSIDFDSIAVDIDDL